MGQTVRGTKASRGQRREDSLTREQIVEASVSLLDRNGEDGFTFRALSEALVTGPGAIYGHIANKSDLLTAACDAIVARTLETPTLPDAPDATPEATIRALALALFDAMDEHPWVGSALTRAPGQSPMVRIVERLGQQICALGVPRSEHWITASALLNYILGVGGRNAANGQIARAQGLDRDAFLDSVAETWSHLDATAYPFVRSLAGAIRTHDDRADFCAGIDLILKGIGSPGSDGPGSRI